MRESLKVGETLTLSSCGKTTVREVVITKKLGEGANSIAYEVTGTENGIPYVLKECCPHLGASRKPDDATVYWESEEQKQAAFDRFLRSYEVQFELQRNHSTENTNVPLAEELLFANNTCYTLVNRRNIETYTSAKDETLQQIFVTARAIARAVSAYHSSGYLHLDIKPDNVMVYPETRDMILLLDFDSIIEKRNVMSTESLSYSPGFCAPEQAQHRRNRICEATDRYAIGAIVYSRIFGRFPDSTDMGSFSRWDYDDNRFFKSMSRKVMRYTTDFLHMTLAASPSRRYSSDEELILALDRLVELSDPSRNHIVSADIRSVNTFVGRQKELDAIRSNLLSDGSNILVLHGIGGIGKTELAIRAAIEVRTYFDTICFGTYRDSLDKLFHDRSFITLSDGAAPQGLTDVKRFLDNRTLLIIDGFDTINDFQMKELFHLPCKILITSRYNLREQYSTVGQIEIAELDTFSQEQLFLMKAKSSVDKNDQKDIKNLLLAVNGFTLLIPLLADLCRRSIYSVGDLTKVITQTGFAALPKDRVVCNKDLPVSDSISNILLAVLDVTGFDAMEKHVMGSLSLLSNFDIERIQLLDWIGREYGNVINSLADRGWIMIRGDGKQAVITLHPIIGQIYKEYARPSLEEFCWISDLCNSFVDEYYNNQDNCELIDRIDKKVSLFDLLCGLIEESSIDNTQQITHAIEILISITGFYKLRQFATDELSSAIMRIKSSSKASMLPATEQWKMSYLDFLSTTKHLYNELLMEYFPYGASEEYLANDNDRFHSLSALIESAKECIRYFEKNFVGQEENYIRCLVNIRNYCSDIGLECFVNMDRTLNVSAVQEFKDFYNSVSNSIIVFFDSDSDLRYLKGFYNKSLADFNKRMSVEQYSHGEKYWTGNEREAMDDYYYSELFAEREKWLSTLSPEEQQLVDVALQNYGYLSEFHKRCRACTSPEEIVQLSEWASKEQKHFQEIHEFVFRNPGIVKKTRIEISLALETELYFALCVISCFLHDSKTAAEYYLDHLKNDLFGSFFVFGLDAERTQDLEFLKTITDEDSFNAIVYHVLQYIEQYTDYNMIFTPIGKAELALKLSEIIRDNNLIAKYKETLLQLRIESDREQGIRFRKKE